MKAPMHVAVTGAAGQIGYALLFRIAAGDLLGKDQPVVLRLLEVTPALKALKGVEMELLDGAFPLLRGIVATDDASVAFSGVDVAMLVGARPRGPGMERKDLLEANAAIFSAQGRALNDHAKRSVKVLVVGNPANTNALIAMRNAPDLGPANFSAMTRLDHNRAISQLAVKTGADTIDVKRMIIWGNHSNTQVPDVAHATVARSPGARPRRARLGRIDLRPDRAEARRRGHRGARCVERRVGGRGGDRPRARLGARHARGRLGEHGDP